MTSQTIGSRRQVWNGTAKKTSGGLHKSDLIMNKHHRIVSKNKSISSKKHNRLLEHGYGTKKGKFGFVRIGSKSSSKKHRKKGKKMRGGYNGLNPSDVNGSYMIDNVNAQNNSPLGRALQAGGQLQLGGRGRSRSVGMAGGSGIGLSLDNPGNANWNGDNLVGGRRRRRGHRSRRMRGGTTSHRLDPANYNDSDPLNRALGAS
jgi:hypothetical protein